MDKNGRTYKSVKNVAFGLGLAVLNTLIGFVNRTFFIKYLGPDYLGLNGLFTEVIAVLSLAELGVGMAINYSLYKPIHENDTVRINQLMSLFRKSYNFISIAVFVIGMAILPFVHLIVKETTYSISYIRLVFFLYVINSSISYLFSYNTSFIGANQKQYVISLVQSIAKVVFTVCSIIVIVTTQNYILYLLLIIAQTLCTNVALAAYVKKKYKFIDYKDSLPLEERRSVFRDIKNIFIKRVSGVITSSTDNILISSLVSTIQVGFYSNYLMFFSLVRTIKMHFSDGIKASIGDLSVSETAEKGKLILNRLTFMYYAFAVVFCSGLLACSTDVITLWIGSKYVMAELVVLIAVFNLYIEIWSEPLWQYLEVSGLFRQDRNIAIVGSVINLIVSFLLGIKIGIVGIFLGTVCTQLIQLVLKARLLFTSKFYLESKDFFIIVGKCMVGYLVLVVLFYACNHWIVISNLWVSILVKGMIAVIVGILMAIVPFIRTDELSFSLQFLKSITRARIRNN